MVKKLAIDWDDGELRLVAAQCSGRSVKVTHAAVLPIEAGGIQATLRSAIAARDLKDAETLVAIGRGRAELRELQLPPVPDDELPDMVRFQAIRSFASAGDQATVDYLVTNRKPDGIEMIAAAVTPASLKEITTLGQQVGLPIRRVTLRPLSAAALYLIHHSGKGERDTVLIDLLTDDAEIVVAREGRVIFVRTVRMPTTTSGRGRALAGELKRSLVACGSSGSLERVVLWGKESVHADDVQMLGDASGAAVQVLDPFSLVEVDRNLSETIPEHVGRLAPLVGLLAADENDSDRLIDFLNPRKKIEEVPSPYLKVALFGVPAAAVLLIAGAVYFQLGGLDQQIAELKASNAAMKSDVDAAVESVQRTEKIDQYLDGDVNWLKEIRRLATKIPPADELIVRQINGNTDVRNGGGTLKVEGAVTQPGVIDSFEQALRDDDHRVTGDGASEQRTNDAYRWGFVETISVTAEHVRNQRYEAIATLLASEAAGSSEAADSGDATDPEAPDSGEATESDETDANDVTAEATTTVAPVDQPADAETAPTDLPPEAPPPDDTSAAPVESTTATPTTSEPEATETEPTATSGEATSNNGESQPAPATDSNSPETPETTTEASDDLESEVRSEVQS